MKKENEDEYEKGQDGGNQPYIKPTKFEGRCEGLKGHVFDCSGIKSVDKFQVTLKEIVTYITKEYHHGQDTRKELEKMAAYQIPIPT
eukprot:9761070-Ditylum_brightwellii.AAC.1